MEALSGLGGDITVIMIAHRLSTVIQCDNILVVDKGQVEALGTYEELIETSETFKKLVSSGTRYTRSHVL